MKKCKRKKAFIGTMAGSVIGAGLQIVASAIQANKKRKAMEEQQQMQNKLDATNQAAALTSAYANQEYADDFKKKVTLKAGGKRKIVNNNDRITKEKQFKCGGRKKYNNGGVTVAQATPPTQLQGVQPTVQVASGGTGGQIANAAGGIMGGIAAIASAAMQPKKRIIQRETMNAVTKINNGTKDYQTDANGNVIQPQTQDNINNTIQTNPVTKPQNAFAIDRPSSARLGIKKYKKRG